MMQVKCIAQWPLQKLQSQCSINYTRIVAAAVALVIQVVVSEVGIVAVVAIVMLSLSGR